MTDLAYHPESEILHAIQEKGIYRITVPGGDLPIYQLAADNLRRNGHDLMGPIAEFPDGKSGDYNIRIMTREHWKINGK